MSWPKGVGVVELPDRRWIGHLDGQGHALVLVCALVTWHAWPEYACRYILDTFVTSTCLRWGDPGRGQVDPLALAGAVAHVELKRFLSDVIHDRVEKGLCTLFVHTRSMGPHMA